VRLLALFLIPVAAFAAAYAVLKPVVRQNRWFVIASNVALDSLRRVGVKSDQIGQETFATPPDSAIPAHLARMRSVYSQFLKYSGRTTDQVAGSRVLELGPGFTMSIPLLFTADGASYTFGIDKFVPFQTGPYYQHYYAQLRNTLTPAQRARYDRALATTPLALNPSLVGHAHHKELQDVVQQLVPESYDMIVSNAVMEEIYDPTPSLQAQAKLLRPGGAMVHMIDLRDYGMFSDRGFHPLEFLTVPDWIYRLMVEKSGQPDRRLMGYYRDAATRMGFKSSFYITHVLGQLAALSEPVQELREGVHYTAADLRQLAELRPRLQPQFRSLPDSELLAQSIIFVAWKPEAVVSKPAETRSTTP